MTRISRRQLAPTGFAAATVLIVTLCLSACAASQNATGTSDALASPRQIEQQTGEITIEDGYIEPGGSISAFDEQLPAIAKLTPELRAAVQAAATAADRDGITFVVTSGWRSAEYQQQLLDAATEKYGSLEEARKHVNTPERSSHVTGDGVDIGYTDGYSWLGQHGARYGLCQTYTNESWHFELSTEPGGECPPQKPNAAA